MNCRDFGLGDTVPPTRRLRHGYDNAADYGNETTATKRKIVAHRIARDMRLSMLLVRSLTNS
jgi:hypothetical protein